jgi:uncharacterized protein YjiS (DUF1127 family)
LERTIMSHYLHREAAAAALAQHRPISRHQVLRAASDLLRTWIERRRQRQELRNYLAIDHRAPADLGVAGNDARDWADRPFWRP